MLTFLNVYKATRSRYHAWIAGYNEWYFVAMPPSNKIKHTKNLQGGFLLSHTTYFYIDTIATYVAQIFWITASYLSENLFHTRLNF